MASASAHLSDSRAASRSCSKTATKGAMTKLRSTCGLAAIVPNFDTKE